MVLSGRLKIVILSVAILVVGGGILWIGLRDRQAPLPTSTTNAAATTTTNTNLAALPVTPDADRDGLSDADEATLGTDPILADTDRDGLDDFAETKIYQTEPRKADTDSDGLSDGIEVDRQLNPKGAGPLLDTPKAIESLTTTNP